MGVAVGLAAALAGHAPPAPRRGEAHPVSPAESLTGYPLPPAPDLARWLTAWQPDLLWLLVVGPSRPGLPGRASAGCGRAATAGRPPAPSAGSLGLAAAASTSPAAARRPTAG